MPRFTIIGAVLLLWAIQALAGGGTGTVVRETWDTAYLGGSKAGYIHTIVRSLDKGDPKVTQTTVEYRLHVKRFNEVLQLGMDVGDEATADGTVTGIFMRQYQGGEKKLDLRGQVVGKQLHLGLADGKKLQPAPWPASVVGLWHQQTLFPDRNARPGDRFDYLRFEPTINLVLTTHVHVKDFEMVEMGPGKGKQKLLRVESREDPIEGVKLPVLVQWLDGQLEPVRAQTELPIGAITTYRTTKAEATQAATPGELADIGLGQVIKLKNKIANPYAAKKAVYRVQIRDADNASECLAHDARQTFDKVKKGFFELQVAAGPGGEAEKPGDEFLQSSYFINCKDNLVKQHARTAVGTETDPWKAALKIEKWVHNKMRATNDEGLAPADQVARTLQGDCSEYAMLMAAMCRAEGIPSRTAMGLIYADLKGKGPVFSFHMWTEVWVAGQWRPLDATLGRGYVGATHIKVTDHSWHNTQTLTPLLPLYSLLGKIAIEVVRVEY